MHRVATHDFKFVISLLFKFVSDLRQVSGFLWELHTDHIDMIEILLKVALNTITLTLTLLLK